MKRNASQPPSRLKAKTRNIAAPTRKRKTLFEKAFDAANEKIPKIEALEAKLADTIFPAQRKRHKARIKKLNASFARLSKHPELNLFVSQYAEQHEGEIENIADLIKEAKERKLCVMMTDSAVRAHLRYAFGIAGTRGRKRAKP